METTQDDIDAEKFEREYAERSGVTVEELHRHGRWPGRCSCGDGMCEGWQMLHLKDHDDRIRCALLTLLAKKYQRFAEGEPLNVRLGLLTAASLLEAELEAFGLVDHTSDTTKEDFSVNIDPDGDYNSPEDQAYNKEGSHGTLSSGDLSDNP